MRRALPFLQAVSLCAAAVLMVAALSVRSLHAQDARPIPAPTVAPRGIPEDWSNRHVVYTRNGSFEDMVKVRDDPRFIKSMRRQKMQERLRQAKPTDGVSLSKGKSSKVDWAYSLGHHAGMAIGESPAKYTYVTTTTPSCNDFAVYTIDTTRVAAGIQGNLVGLTNLYSGTIPTTGICGTAPTTLFSYAIGSGPSPLSPVISLDGTKVAWIENATTSHAMLHVTTYVAGQGRNAAVGSVAIDEEMNNAPCAPAAGTSCDDEIDYTSLTLTGCTTTSDINTYSDLYVDYPSDTGFIGADNGNLYHISGIFLGTPTFDFCVSVNGANPPILSGTVYDSGTNTVFISDPLTLYSYSVGSTAFTPAASYQYGNGVLTSGPLLDSFNGFVYMFTGDDFTTGHTSMTQLPVDLSSHVVVPLGPASGFSAYPALFLGTFDNNYLTNGPAVAGSTLYTCGTDSTNTAAQYLFAIGFHVNTGVAEFNPVMSANPNVNPSGQQGLCSPIEESFDGTTDRIFVGMGDPNYATDGFGSNVVTMWDVTTQLTDPTTTPTATGTGYLGGTTDFAVDGASSAAQAQSIYFGTLSPDPATGTTLCGNNHYCAVKLTQSTLQ
ncbi:MAG TPA: hypothetical protein VK828_18855 [Terriglobales bacterium]|jgi:hypothetical protein|nr:hypothetical protein [Terriglobales bacterium]